MAAGRIIQTGGPQVGDPCLKGFYRWHIAIDLSNVFRTAHRLWFLLCHSVKKTSSDFSGGKKGGKGELNLVGPFGSESILSLDTIWQEKDPVRVATVSCV